MEFETYESPNKSKLEPYLAEITAMRQAAWPYCKITEWLKEHHHIDIHLESVRRFCLKKSISKITREEASNEPDSKLVKQNPSERNPLAQQKFHYESKPIEIHKESDSHQTFKNK